MVRGKAATSKKFPDKFLTPGPWSLEFASLAWGRLRALPSALLEPRGARSTPTFSSLVDSAGLLDDQSSETRLAGFASAISDSVAEGDVLSWCLVSKCVHGVVASSFRHCITSSSET